MPQVSVLLPVKNAGDYLRQAVDSILQQSLQDVELIIVDDHSQDAALQGLPSDSRIRLYKNHGQGVVAAMRTAARHAQSDYWARMDADDIALPHRLRNQLEYLQRNPEIGLCGAQVEIFTQQEQLSDGYQRYQRWLNALCTPAAIAEHILVESPIPNPTAMFRRETYQQLQGYQESTWHEDYDLYLRAHQLGIAMGKPEGILLHWRDHAARSTRTLARYKVEQLWACKAHYLAAGLPPNKVLWICGTGRIARQLFQALARQGCEVAGFVDFSPAPSATRWGKPVISYASAAKQPEVFFLAAVGAEPARAKLQAWYQGLGLQSGHGYYLCA